jgi:hypothetical protein
MGAILTRVSTWDVGWGWTEGLTWGVRMHTRSGQKGNAS